MSATLRAVLAFTLNPMSSSAGKCSLSCCFAEVVAEFYISGSHARLEGKASIYMSSVEQTRHD
jgi:hypothetical protein